MILRRLKALYYRETTVVVCVVAGWLLVAVLFFTVGHSLISHMYHGTAPVAFLNALVEGQSIHNLDHYLRFADGIFLRWSIWLLSALLFVSFCVYHRPLLTGDGFAPASVPLSLILALAALAWSNRFIQDDAFISFRYASHFAHGFGLTWNPGESPVEGYTNLLWTLLLSIPIRLGIDPIASSFAFGIVFFAGSLSLTYRLAVAVLGSARLAILCVVLLGTNYTFSAYATGGLETQMQTCLLVCIALSAFRLSHLEEWRPSMFALVSLLGAAAVLTRPDSVLPLAVFCFAVMLALLKSPARPAQKLACAASLALPGFAVALGYAWWKLAYYGDLLPNTYYAKVTSGASLARGIKYVWYFLGSYGWIPFVALACANVRQIRSRTRWMLPLASTTALWLLYVVRVGGCFMEFRLLVPVLPFLIILLVAGMPTRRAPVHLACVAGLVLTSFFHGASFRGRNGIESIGQLHGHITGKRWDDCGRVLGELFSGAQPEVTIATTAAGAIPYYSRLRTIDMLGLNDPWVGRNGRVLGTRPGHQRVATASYLLDRQVNLVIGHPKVHDLSAGVRKYTVQNASFSMAEVVPTHFPKGARVIELSLIHI